MWDFGVCYGIVWFVVTSSHIYCLTLGFLVSTMQLDEWHAPELTPSCPLAFYYSGPLALAWRGPSTVAPVYCGPRTRGPGFISCRASRQGPWLLGPALSSHVTTAGPRRAATLALLSHWVEKILEKLLLKKVILQKSLDFMTLAKEKSSIRETLDIFRWANSSTNTKQIQQQ